MEPLDQRIAAALRDVPDFPKPGIVFKDITPLLGAPALFGEICDAMAAQAKAQEADVVAGIESRGFLFGVPVAERLGVPFVPVRKPGKLPAETVRVSYALEYGEDSLELHRDAFASGARVCVVDDVLATGGTAAATARLVAEAGGTLAGYVFLMELGFLDGRAKLGGAAAASLLAL